MFDPMASFPMLLRALNSYSSPGYSQALPMTYEDELQYCLDANHDPLLSPLMTPNATLAKFPRSEFSVQHLFFFLFGSELVLVEGDEPTVVILDHFFQDICPFISINIIYLL